MPIELIRNSKALELMAYDALEYYLRILGILAIAILCLWLAYVAWLIFREARRTVQRRTDTIGVDSVSGVSRVS
jgi:hypothetical protein